MILHESKKSCIFANLCSETRFCFFNCVTTNKKLRTALLWILFIYIMHDTNEEFKIEIARCREIYEKKAKDYGTSWRILRLPSLTDQIYIKASRIRSIQESGENRVGDGVEPEFVAMVNYCVMALIQQELGPEGNQELPLEQAVALYDKHITRATKLMRDKNHDYGEAWRMMRVSSMVDLILMKLRRIKQIEDNHGKTLISEGVEGGYMDIINYSLFCLIRITESKEQ